MDQENNHLLGHTGKKKEKMKGLVSSGLLVLNKFHEGITIIHSDVKAAKVTNTDQETNQDPARNLRVCDFCGKTFDSGKALGGHRRSHIQALKAKGKPKKKAKSHASNYLHRSSKNRNRSSTTLTPNGEKPTCCLCGKGFPSMKSLFGHMRSHPDRLWRGIVPPPSRTSAPTDVADDPPALLSDERNGSLSVNSSDSKKHKEGNSSEDFRSAPIIGDLSKDLSSRGIRWKVRDKRGRASIIEAVAAQGLVSLSHGKYFYSNSDNNMGPDYHLLYNNNKGEKVTESSFSSKRDIFQAANNDGKQSVKIKFYRRWSSNLVHDTAAAADEERGLLSSGVAAAAGEAKGERQWKKETLEKANIEGRSEYKKTRRIKPSMKLGGVSELKIMKKKKKVKVLNVKSQNIETHKAADRLIKCGICRKTFPTFQALGGHRSSHKKDKKGISELDEGTISDTLVFKKPQINNAEGSEPKHNGKTYNHTSRDPLEHESLSAEASYQSDPKQGMSLEASQSNRKMLHIDLNLPYAMEDEGI